MYLALEPYLRRRWPDALVALNRVFAGKFHDPLVGRDLLIGCVTGAAAVLLLYARYFSSRFGGLQISPYSGGDNLYTLDLFSGARMVIACSTGLLGGFIRSNAMTLFFVFLLRILLRRTWITVVVVFVIWTANGVAFGVSDLSPISLIIDALLYSSIAIVLLRYGIVAFAADMLVFELLMGFPITTQLSAWYSGIGLTGLALLLALTLYAFHTSLGGQPLFGRATLED